MGLYEELTTGSMHRIALTLATAMLGMYGIYTVKKSINRITIDDLKQDYLKSMQSGPKIDLRFSQCGVKKVKALAAALESGKCPERLVLNLRGNDIGDEDAKALASALASGLCPEGLRLNLTVNDIGDKGAKALATALASGLCPEGLRLKLRTNDIGDTGAKALATALASGKCPEGLALNLAWNKIGVEGAKALAAALTSGKCPEGLVLNLAGNDIDDEGKAALETALKSGKVRCGTKIVGLGLEQLCIYNDTNITRTSLLTLLSTKKSNLPKPNFLAHAVAPYLSEYVSNDEIKPLIKSITRIQPDISYAGVECNFDIGKLLTKNRNLVRDSTTLASSLSAPVNFFKANVPPYLHVNFEQNSVVSTLLKADSQTNTPPLYENSKNGSPARQKSNLNRPPPLPPVSA